MPHFIAECTDNIREQADLPGLFAKVNEALAATGIFPIGGIRSRALPSGLARGRRLSSGRLRGGDHACARLRRLQADAPERAVAIVFIGMTAHASGDGFNRVASKIATAYSVYDPRQPVRFQILRPLTQQPPLKGLRHRRGIHHIGGDALQRIVRQDL